MRCTFPGCTKWKAINVPTPFCRAHFEPQPTTPPPIISEQPAFRVTVQLGKVSDQKCLSRYEEIEEIARTSEKAMLHQKSLDSTHVPGLCTVLLSEDCPVRELNLFLNTIGYEGAKELANVLRCHQNTQKASLFFSRQDTKISLLNMKCCSLKRDGTIEIFQALETNHSLKVY